jgi:hypothetical protein
MKPNENVEVGPLSWLRSVFDAQLGDQFSYVLRCVKRLV